MDIPQIVLGINGPITNSSNFSNVYLFESAFFDSSSQIPTNTSSAARITLENRFDVILNPMKYIDNQVGGIDMFEYELKSSSHDVDDGKFLVCLHSNHILLQGSKECVDKFKDVCKRYSEKFEFLLMISLPLLAVEDPIEYLVSHVHYGSSKGLFFGALGPLALDNPEVVKVYMEAQKRTGAPLFVDIRDQSQVEICTQFFSSPKNSNLFFIVRDFEIAKNIRDKLLTNIVIPCAQSIPDPRLKSLPNVSFSPGCCLKTDFKKFGGLGFHHGIGWSTKPSNTTTIFSSLSFAWSPPKLNSQQDDDYGKWVCDICGLRAKLSEKENFTKHGYTYCSVACLSSHRKRGFEPLT